jgi:SAM-dependent MidA family methyltransferase
MTLREVIAEEIRARGPIPFSRYMEVCLYHPELGYYSRSEEKFGKDGDFYTSSDVHAIYGRLMARQFDEMWRALGRPAPLHIVELGPGRGPFAQDVLAWAAKKFPALYSALRYVLVETSPALRNALEDRFRAETGSGKVLICRGLEQVPQADSAIVFANEVFDALPVEIIDNRGELRVACDPGGHFTEEFVTPSAEVSEFLERYGVRPQPGERTEACLHLKIVLPKMLKAFQRGFCVIVDYGYTRDELLAGRHRDTVRAFRHHRMTPNVFDSPGDQDITADVNFSAIAVLAKQQKADSLPLITQSQFLLGIGEGTQFADVLEEAVLPQERTKRALQLKHLVAPAGMGEAFHVLLLTKGVEKKMTQQLSGFSFGK